MTTTRFGFDEFGAGSDPATGIGPAISELQTITDASAMKWARTDGLNLKGVSGEMRAMPNTYGTALYESTDVLGDSANDVWRGTVEVLRFSDYIAAADDTIGEVTAAFRRATAAARLRGVPLYLNQALIDINTAGTPIDCSGVDMIGIRSGTQVKNWSEVPDDFTFEWTTGLYGSGGLSHVKMTNYAGSLGPIKINTTDDFVHIRDVTIDLTYGGTNGCIRIVGSSPDYNASGGSVILERCVIRKIAWGTPPAPTSIGILANGGEKVLVRDCTFSGFTETVRMVSGGCSVDIANSFLVDDVNMYSTTGTRTIGIRNLNTAVLSVRNVAMLYIDLPFSVVSTANQAYVTIEDVIMIGVNTAMTDNASATRYPFLFWQANHGQLWLRDCYADPRNTATKTGIWLQDMTSKFAGIRTQQCRSHTVPADFIYLHNGGTSHMAKQLMHITLAAGIPSAIADL